LTARQREARGLYGFELRGCSKQRTRFLTRNTGEAAMTSRGLLGDEEKSRPTKLDGISSCVESLTTVPPAVKSA
jgi:hypothetical protein